MNFLFFEATPRWSGGANRALSFGREMKKRGHNVTICCLPGSGLSERASADNIRVCTVDPRSQANLFMVPKIMKLIRKEKIDIIDIYSPKFYWIASFAGKFCGTKVMLTRTVPYRKKGLKKFLNSILYRKQVDAVIAVSEKVRRELVEDYHIPDNKITCIHDGMDIRPFLDSKPLSFRKSPDERIVAIISRLDGNKGLECFFKAIPGILEHLPLVRFLIVGTGGIEQELIRMTETLGVSEQVTFTGFRTDIPEILAGVDITVIPSPQEGMSTTALESMAAGRPVVATSGGGLVDIIYNGRSGFIVKPDDRNALVDGIIRILQSDFSRMGLEARNIVRKKFNPDNVANEYEAFAKKKKS